MMQWLMAVKRINPRFQSNDAPGLVKEPQSIFFSKSERGSIPLTQLFLVFIF
jgi:hypothetical protein